MRPGSWQETARRPAGGRADLLATEKGQKRGEQLTNTGQETQSMSTKAERAHGWNVYVSLQRTRIKLWPVAAAAR